MGRSVSYLDKALKVNYFQSTEEDDLGWEFLVEDIQETIISNYPEFEAVGKWDGNETRIILEGYGVQIGLSEYCGLCSLSVRVDESLYEYYGQADYPKAFEWVENNWAEASKYWDELRRIGTFSNGEGVYELKK